MKRKNSLSGVKIIDYSKKIVYYFYKINNFLIV